jgi:hypothetical protein
MNDRMIGRKGNAPCCPDCDEMRRKARHASQRRIIYKRTAKRRERNEWRREVADFLLDEAL